MAVATLDVLHGIQTASDFISQITSATVSPQIQTLVSTPAGLPWPMFAGNLGQNPDITFESNQIKTILDLTGIDIVDLSGGNTDLLFKRTKSLASREADATTVHTRLRAAQAALVVNQLSAGHQSEASVSCRLVLPWDGSNEPIVPAGTVALTGAVPIAAEHYLAGEVWLNSLQIEGIQDITIDFGNSLIEAGGEGELYNTFAAIQSTNPVITITTLDMPWVVATPVLGLNGVAITALSVYLRKTATTTRVTDVTAGHIKFSGTAGYAFIAQTPGGGNDPVVTTIQCQMASPNATTAPLLVNTAIAITD